MGRNVLLRGLTAAFLAALVGCHSMAPPLRSDAAGTLPGAAADKMAGNAIVGRVDFPPLRKAQATSADVVSAATVSLIDTATQNTVASGKTDSTGNFTVALGSYSPGTQAYVLEAVKGLASNNPGADAARFRTILKFANGAWASCSNATPGVGSIVINSHTTALAVQSALDPVNVAPLNTIGKVNVGTVPATFFTPMSFTSHPDSEFDNLAADLLNFLSADADPVSSVTSIKPTISGFEPASALPNALVRINGKGFSPSLSGNTVTFATGQAASVVLSTPNSMIVVVPSGATSGTLQVKTIRGSVTSATAFNVLAAAAGGQTLSITSFTPSYGRPGTRLTLTGQFGSTQGNVYFAGPSSTQVPGKVASWTANTIQVDVPTAAQYGRITVASGQNSAVSAADFDTWQGDLGYMVNAYGAGYGVYTVPHSGYGASPAVYGSPTAKYVYLVAGTDNSVGSQGPYTNSAGGFNVFMWTVAADGTLGAAKWVGRLNIPRYESTAIIVGNFLYVIGGYDGQPAATYAGHFGPQLRSIERATINPADGTLSTAGGTKGAFDQLGDLLQTNGRYQHRSFTGVVNGTTYLWCLGGYSATGGNGRTDYEQFSVNTSTGALTSVRAAPLNGPSGIFSIYRFGAQLIGSGILIAGGLYNGGYWGGTMTIPVNQTTGALETGVTGPSAINCPSYSASYGKYGGQLSRVNGKVFWFSGYHPTIGYANAEILAANVNTSNGQISGAWACGSTGAPNSSARNQNWNTNWNDQNAVIQNGGINRIYQFGGNNAGYYIQHTEVLSDGSLTRTHGLGSTRDGHYYAATLALNDKAWVIGGYRTSDGVYTDTTEYYVMRDDGIITAPTMGPKLTRARYYPSWSTAKGYLYIIGGYNPSEGALDSVERAQINADGTLGAFSLMPYRMNIRTYQGAAITVGNYLYQVGGLQQAGSSIATIERALVNADGSLGPWEIQQHYLPYTAYGHSLRQIGNFVYLLAGTGSMSTNFVMRAQVYADGSLGQFTRPSVSDQSVTGAWGSGVEVFGNYLYRCFGNGDQTNCYRSFINADATLGNWAIWQPQGRTILPTSAYDGIGHAMYRWNDRVFWLSGINSGWNIYTGSLR